MSFGTEIPFSMVTSKSKKCCWCGKLVYGPVLVHGLTAATVHRYCAVQIGMHAFVQREDGGAGMAPAYAVIERPSIEWAAADAPKTEEKISVTPEGNEPEQLNLF